jgi:hypothetical protein
LPAALSTADVEIDESLRVVTHGSKGGIALRADGDHSRGGQRLFIEFTQAITKSVSARRAARWRAETAPSARVRPAPRAAASRLSCGTRREHLELHPELGYQTTLLRWTVQATISEASVYEKIGGSGTNWIATQNAHHGDLASVQG